MYDLIKIASIDELKKKNIAVKSKYNNKLNNLIIKHKKRAYITLNPICPDDCEYYEEHRKYIEQEQRNFYDISNVYLCPLKANTGFYDLFKHSNFITEEKMSDFIKAGFRNFRIDFPSIEKCMDINYGLYDTLESYLYYLIKPEYRSKIRNLMIKKYTARKNNG